MFYLTTHSTHYIYCYLTSVIRKEGNVLFNDALNTLHLLLHNVGHMVKNNSGGERENPLPLLNGLLFFSISSKGSFICNIPQTGCHIPPFGTNFFRKKKYFF